MRSAESLEFRSSARRWLVIAVVALLNGAILWHFHDRYWYPTDDGFYGNIAERLLSGETLNGTIQDIHPGYVHFVNAAAFKLFGIDLVSLRYPLVAAALGQAVLVYLLLARRDAALATLASVASTALGVIQFVDPTPNWYALNLCVAMIAWLVWFPREHPIRLAGAGALVGLLALFRQLSGVWAAMGLLVVVLLERSDEDDSGRGLLLARGLLLLMLAAIVWYLAVSPETEPGGVLLMAIWPMGILAWAIVHVRSANRATVARVGQLAAGAIVPLLPLLLYHLVNGSVGNWIDDTVLAAFGETQMPFFGKGWYGVLPIAGLFQMTSRADPVKIANGLYWLVLPLISAVNGFLILSHLRRSTRDIEELVLPLVASFYALGSLYFEGPLYLYYTVGLSLVSVLWLVAPSSRPSRIAWGCLAAGLSVVAVVFHAGQTRLRTSIEILEGRIVSNVWSHERLGLRRCSLRLDLPDRELYGALVAFIEQETKPGEPILVLPNDAELYFLGSRRNPVRFYNSALGIRSRDDVLHVLQTLSTDRPRVVAFRPVDKYNNDLSAQVMDVVRQHYMLVETIGGLELYRRREL